MEDSNYISKGPCDACGSSDANALYDDGHTFCFACENLVSADGAKDAEEIPKELLHYEVTPLTKRGITISTCKRYGYGVGQYYGKPVQIANYRRGNRVVAQHLRTMDKDFPWVGETKHLDMFGQHLYKSGGKTIVITEGEIDALSIAQVMNFGIAVMSIPTGVKSAVKSIKQHLEYIESFNEIILAFDDDEPGQQGVDECAVLFTPGRVKVMSYLGHKDANELLQAKMSKELIECLFNAKTFRPDGIMSGRELFKQMKKRESKRKGFDIPYAQLNEDLLGVRNAELYMWTAGSGIGKSTIVNEIAYHLQQEHGQTLGILALEESPVANGDRYISLHTNTPYYRLDELSQEEYEAAGNATVNTDKYYIYDHWGSTNIDNLLSKVRYMIVGCGVEIVLLDHISIVVSGLSEKQESERKTIDRLMTGLRALVNETGVAIHAVVHLKRPDSPGKGFNEGRPVRLSDLRGSASLEQLSDYVIALERDQQGDNPNIVRIRILKGGRFGKGKTGPAGYAIYNEYTGRLQDYVPSPDEKKNSKQTKSNYKSGYKPKGSNDDF